MSRPAKDYTETLVNAICTRCGWAWQYPSNYIGRGYDGSLCADCKARPAVVAKSKLVDTPCRPWTGEVDDLFRPLKDGRLYKPGNRVCGYKDCVAKAHIQAA